MGREFELKYRLSPEQYRLLLPLLPEPARKIAMHTTYYDTPSGALSARKWTLRLRMEDELAVCTIKTPMSGPGRGEWECRRGDIREAIPELCKLGCPGELASLASEGLVAVCGARFTRLCGPITAGGAEIELALDAGVLTGGGRELPFTELEAELKSGSDGDLIAFCRGLEARFGLVPEPKSKFRRALALAREGSYGLL